jgi:hypothetical protein
MIDREINQFLLHDVAIDFNTHFEGEHQTQFKKAA